MHRELQIFDHYNQVNVDEIVDPYRFQWTVVETNFCTKQNHSLDALIIVHSATDHFESRRMLRQTYREINYDKVWVVHTKSIL